MAQHLKTTSVLKQPVLHSNQSFWHECEVPQFPELHENLTTDVLIIGGGIAGLSAAYLLSETGRKITLVDSREIGSGDSGFTTAHLTMVLDERYYELIQSHGKEEAQLILESHEHAIDTIEEIVKKENIDCNFVRLPGYLYSENENDVKTFESEFRALHDLRYMEAALGKISPYSYLDAKHILTFPNQAKFHPLKYLYAIANIVKDRGVSIYHHTHVSEVKNNSVTTENGLHIAANHVVVATHSPVKNILFFLKQAAYRSYVIGAKIYRGAVPEALFWDTEDPYHYVRLEPLDDKNDLIIIGGEDHKTGQLERSEKPFQKLESWARAHFPMISNISYRWSGQIIEPNDSLAFIGQSPFHEDHVYLATGFSGNGYTYGTIAGLMIRDLIEKRENPWVSIYDPRRKKSYATKDFFSENVNTITKMANGYLKPETTDADDVAPGNGAVIGNSFHKQACYRDEKGELHIFSAVCPHLGCIVQWNPEEKTFDCPCHGSRFSAAEGKVLNGPAIKDLKRVSGTA